MYGLILIVYMEIWKSISMNLHHPHHHHQTYHPHLVIVAVVIVWSSCFFGAWSDVNTSICGQCRVQTWQENVVTYVHTDIHAKYMHTYATYMHMFTCLYSL